MVVYHNHRSIFICTECSYHKPIQHLKRPDDSDEWTESNDINWLDQKHKNISKHKVLDILLFWPTNPKIEMVSVSWKISHLLLCYRGDEGRRLCCILYGGALKVRSYHRLLDISTVNIQTWPSRTERAELLEWAKQRILRLNGEIKK